MLKKLTIFLSSAVMLSAGVAYGAPTLRSSVNGESTLLAQTTCVTEVDELPTADADVDYVTQDTACFNEEDNVVIEDETYDIQYDDARGYYYVVYNSVPWYFVNWNGVTLLTNGNAYVAVAFAE